MEIHGLDPRHAARLTVLTEEFRSLLIGDGGMDAVQSFLSDRKVGVMDSIMITRELLGAEHGDLGRAKDIVLSSSSRTKEHQIHHAFMDDLLEALDE